LDSTFYTYRPRELDETFPWDHIGTAVRKNFLSEDYLWSQRSQTRVDCRQRCFACGILPTFAETRSQNPGDVWKCPEVTPKAQRGQHKHGEHQLIQIVDPPARAKLVEKCACE
jgi:hypothetical protein